MFDWILNTPQGFIQARNPLWEHRNNMLNKFSVSKKYHFLTRHHDVFTINVEHTSNSLMEEFCKKFGLKNSWGGNLPELLLIKLQALTLQPSYIETWLWHMYLLWVLRNLSERLLIEYLWMAASLDSLVVSTTNVLPT